VLRGGPDCFFGGDVVARLAAPTVNKGGIANREVAEVDGFGKRA
jgi:hypothetical protein